MNTRTYSLLRSTVSACRKAGREDPGSLGVQELPPGRARAARRWIDARSVQDLPDGGRGDRHAELGQLAVDAAVSPQWILFRQADGEAGDARSCRRAAGCARLLVSYLPAASLRCQASSVAGVIGKMAALRLRGMSRASAASHTRSAGRTGPGRRGGAAPRSRGGARAARHPSPGRCGISGQRGRVSGEALHG